MDQDRKTAYDILMDIEKNDAFSNLSVKSHLTGKNVNSAFVRQLVYGTLENQIYLDNIIDQLASKGIKGMKDKTLVLIRMGLYQLIYMDSVPNYAAINETVAIAKKIAYGTEKFINGMLRGYLKKKDLTDFLPDRSDLIRYLSIKYSYNDWIVDLWSQQFNLEELEKLLAAGNKKPRLCIRVNNSKISTHQLYEKLVDKGFEPEKSMYSARGILVKGNDLLSEDLYDNGFFSVQDETSILTADTVEPMDGDYIIDMCAAPGGKTLAMAEAMEGGRVLAMDLYEHKLKLIQGQAQRLGIDCITTRMADSTVLQEDLINKADRVLADVPCSGLGVIRHKPEIKLKGVQELDKLYSIQADILSNAGKYVKKGGILVYSTCTINEKENQQQVRMFLNNNPQFDLLESKQFLPHIDNTDGFYIAKLVHR